MVPTNHRVLAVVVKRSVVVSAAAIEHGAEDSLHIPVFLVPAHAGEDLVFPAEVVIHACVELVGVIARPRRPCVVVVGLAHRAGVRRRICRLEKFQGVRIDLRCAHHVCRIAAGRS